MTADGLSKKRPQKAQDCKNWSAASKPQSSCSSQVGDASQPPNSVKNAEPPNLARSFCTERKSAGPSTSSQSTRSNCGMVSLPGTGIKDRIIQ